MNNSSSFSSEELSQEMYRQVYDIIATKKFKGQNYMSDQNFFRKIIQFLKQLTVGQEQFRIVKMLIQHFGIFILPFLKPYYRNIRKQHNQQMQINLEALALYAKNSVQNRNIHEIQFLYQYGVSDSIIKKKNKDENQMEFLQSIQSLSGFNKNIENNVTNGKLIQEYKNFVKKLKEKSEGSMYELKIIDQLMIKDSDLDSLQKQFKQSEIVKKQPSESSQNSKTKKYASQITAVTEQKRQSHINNFPSVIQEDYSKESGSLSVRKQYLCCKRFFLQDQIIREAEDARTSFIHIRYPYNNMQITKIKEIMCSFLNSEGGVLYIGILKEQSSKKSVLGGYYSESQKEQVLKTFRKIAQTIEPDIITNKMYLIDFVPIRERKEPHKFSPGMYIVKVTVKYGVRDDIYSYRDHQTDLFIFRTENELIYKEGRQLLKNLRERIRNPLPIPVPTHEGPCEKPLIGQQTHDIEGQKILKIQKPLYQQKIEKPIKEKIDSSKESYKRILPKEIVVQQAPRIQKQHCHQCYFYIIGLNETQLSDALKKKSLFQGVKLQNITRRPKWFVIKSLKQQLNASLRKLFKKIEQKYGKSGIKTYEIKMGLLVNDIVQAKELNKKHKIQYEIKNHNYLIFSSIKDSLTMFIVYEQQKLEPSFIDP